MFIGTSTGMVSATTRPPICGRGRRPRGGGRCGRARRSTVSTFQLSGRLAAARHRGDSSISSSPNRSRQPSKMPSSVVPACSADRLAQRQQLVGLGPARRDRLAVAVGVRVRQRGREAEAAGLERVAAARQHGRDLLGVGLVADGVGAHHVAAERAVADEEPGVHGDVALERGRGTRRSVSQLQSTPCSSAASGMPSTFAIMRRV